MAIGMLVVPTWKRLIKASSARHEIAEADAQRHGGEDPDRQVAVEKREFFGNFTHDLSRSGCHRVAIGQGAQAFNANRLFLSSGTTA